MKIERIIKDSLVIKRYTNEGEVVPEIEVGEGGTAVIAEVARTFIEGYAAVWMSDSILLTDENGQFIERIAPNAFSTALANLETETFDCVATYNHDRMEPLARTAANTLTLKQDTKGLFFSFEAPTYEMAVKLVERIERKEISACSFVALYNPNSVVEERIGGIVYRTINEFTAIRDVALVVDAAYRATSIEEIERSYSEFVEKENATLLAHRNAIDSQTTIINNLILKSKIKTK